MAYLNSIPTDKKIYGNCSVQSPDGILMFRCDEKKSNWYLSRNLAEVISEDPYTIRLLFTPKGYGNHGKGWGLDPLENECVRCGTTESLTKHHVVPYMYRKHFPEELKSRNHHDVLSMCVPCHERYERFADSLKHDLLKETGHIPHTPSTSTDANLHRKRQGLVRIIMNPDTKIPKERIQQIREDFFTMTPEWDGKDDSFLLDIISEKKTHRQEGDAGLTVVDFHRNHLKDFIRQWRRHFLDMNECEHLPENWSINYFPDIKINM